MANRENDPNRLPTTPAQPTPQPVPRPDPDHDAIVREPAAQPVKPAPVTPRSDDE